jgi:hypothetical protein
LSIRVAKSRGYAISYEDDGYGPAVVLVNGFASPAAEWRKFGYVDRSVTGSECEACTSWPPLSTRAL